MLAGDWLEIILSNEGNLSARLPSHISPRLIAGQPTATYQHAELKIE